MVGAGGLQLRAVAEAPSNADGGEFGVNGSGHVGSGIADVEDSGGVGFHLLDYSEDGGGVGLEGDAVDLADDQFEGVGSEESPADFLDVGLRLVGQDGLPDATLGQLVEELSYTRVGHGVVELMVDVVGEAEAEQFLGQVGAVGR